MENYEVIRSLGAGSFGRVYKARQLSTGIFVALKVISKRGKSSKELGGLRTECEIQRNLHHPNIIKMLDSFETKDELVVITEFAHKELNKLLGKEGYLSEAKALPIICDLVSALYYLHSHRILHRDLKPQNILLDANNRAKLCDFGFARNMSTGTHVLTSIKGTPLYMAPELIDAQSYNHSADLWSLGCIIYELLLGAPPFNTTSILNLIKLVRQGHIEWPNFLSEHCISFLKGLLKKDPRERLPWPEILDHPFVKGKILLVDNKNGIVPNDEEVSNEPNQKTGSLSEDLKYVKKSSEISKAFGELSINSSSNKMISKSCDNKLMSNTSNFTKLGKCSEDTESSQNLMEPNISVQSFEFIEETQPLENDEWLVFLRKVLADIFNGEYTFLTQTNQVKMLITPLRNSNTTSKVIQHVVWVCCIGLMEPDSPITSRDNAASKSIQTITIQNVFLQTKLVPNLIYATKLLLKPSSVSKSTNSMEDNTFKPCSMLTNDELQCLDDIYTLLTHLVHKDKQFLSQFCDATLVFRAYSIYYNFYASNIHVKIVANLTACLVQVLKQCPENSEIVEKSLRSECEENLEFLTYLRHSDVQLRNYICLLILYGLKHLKHELIWNEEIGKCIEEFCNDNNEQIRIIAEKILYSVKHKDYTSG